MVDALSDGPRRFAELASALPEIATNVLTQRLRRLEADGLVIAVPYSTRPRRFAYELTEPGRGLGGVAAPAGAMERRPRRWYVGHPRPCRVRHSAGGPLVVSDL